MTLFAQTGANLKLSPIRLTVFHTAQNAQKRVGRLAPPGLQSPALFASMDQSPVIFGPGRIGHFKVRHLLPFPQSKGLIMLGKILLGLICASCLIAFAVGGLGLLLGIGPMFVSLAYTAIGGFGLVVFSGLIAD